MGKSTATRSSSAKKTSSPSPKAKKNRDKKAKRRSRSGERKGGKGIIGDGDDEKGKQDDDDDDDEKTTPNETQQDLSALIIGTTRRSEESTDVTHEEGRKPQVHRNESQTETNLDEIIDNAREVEGAPSSSLHDLDRKSDEVIETKPLTPREARRRRRDELRSQKLGVGLQIDIGTESTKSPSPSNSSRGNRKITNFDDYISKDDMNDKEEEEEEESRQTEAPAREDKPVDNDEKDQSNHDSDDDDDDDGPVEEVTTSRAKKDALEQRAQERETAATQRVLEAKKKKRKKNKLEKIPDQDEAPADSEQQQSVEEMEDEDEFDDAFFSQVDSEMKEQRRAQKREAAKADTSKPRGTHITFAYGNDENGVATSSKPIPVQGYKHLELVRLPPEHYTAQQKQAFMEEGLVGTEESPFSTTATEPSGLSSSNKSSVQLFSRSAISNGLRVKLGTDSGKGKRKRIEGWTRSNKMTRVVLSKIRKRKAVMKKR